MSDDRAERLAGTMDRLQDAADAYARLYAATAVRALAAEVRALDDLTVTVDAVIRALLNAADRLEQ